jgi:hypothetical protein
MEARPRACRRTYPQRREEVGLTLGRLAAKAHVSKATCGACSASPTRWAQACRTCSDGTLLVDPPSLEEFAKDAKLSQRDVRMLAGVNFRGQQPDDKAGWNSSGAPSKPVSTSRSWDQGRGPRRQVPFAAVVDRTRTTRLGSCPVLSPSLCTAKRRRPPSTMPAMTQRRLKPGEQARVLIDEPRGVGSPSIAASNLDLAPRERPREPSVGTVRPLAKALELPLSELAKRAERSRHRLADWP